MHLEVFTHKELILTINFKFGRQKVETTCILSNLVWDFIDGEEHTVMQITNSHANNYEKMKK
jgi:hypothetical protein